MTSLCLSESRILARWDATESAYWVMWTCGEDTRPRDGDLDPEGFVANRNRKYLQGRIQAVVVLRRGSFGGGRNLVGHHAPPTVGDGGWGGALAIC